MITKEFEVDFDFGEGGRCDGIDPWFLQHFVLHNKDVKRRYSCFTASGQIASLLQVLEGDGLFARDLELFLGRPMEIYNDRQFYLVSSIHDPDTPVWKPYWPQDAGFDDEAL